ncbi:MAG: hypothetical protein LBH48_04255 [Bifidobacteriaceae bacterium]|jgi:hypothetical protein|nr:hypothetical protein [Bifidobacteriaceae bacterium]
MSTGQEPEYRGPRLVVATAVLLFMGAATGLYATGSGWGELRAAGNDRAIVRYIGSCYDALGALDQEARAAGTDPDGAQAARNLSDAAFAQVADAKKPSLNDPAKEDIAEFLADPPATLAAVRSSDPNASSNSRPSYEWLRDTISSVYVHFSAQLDDPTLTAYARGVIEDPLAEQPVISDGDTNPVFATDMMDGAGSIYSSAMSRLVFTIIATLIAAAGLVFTVRFWLAHRPTKRAKQTEQPEELAAPAPTAPPEPVGQPAQAVPIPPIPPILVQPGRARLAPAPTDAPNYSPLVHTPPGGRPAPPAVAPPVEPSVGTTMTMAALAPATGPFDSGGALQPEMPVAPPVVSYIPPRPTASRPIPVQPAAPQPIQPRPAPLGAMVTRMQRHADALIALARADETPPGARAERIDDIVVAAATRLGIGARVRMRAQTVPTIQARFVPTLRHLLVEVLDNAARFSGPGADIDVAVGPLRGGAIVQITDYGPGMTSADFAEATRVMAASVDPTTTGPQASRMGLVVVARAATVLGARVRISPVRSHTGTHVAVALPETIFAGAWQTSAPRAAQ